MRDRTILYRMVLSFSSAKSLSNLLSWEWTGRHPIIESIQSALAHISERPREFVVSLWEQKRDGKSLGSSFHSE